MRTFKRQLRLRIFLYFVINILISFIVLKVSLPYVQEINSSATHSMPNLGFAFDFGTLILYWIFGLGAFTVSPTKYPEYKSIAKISYLFLPILFFCFILYISNFHVFSKGYNLLGIISFLIGQIISLILVLKFIKENKTEKY